LIEQKEETVEMVLLDMIQKLRKLVGNHQPYIASKGYGRWSIRHYDPVLKRWTDNGQTFFNKDAAKSRLKDVRQSLKKRAG